MTVVAAVARATGRTGHGGGISKGVGTGIGIGGADGVVDKVGSRGGGIGGIGNDTAPTGEGSCCCGGGEAVSPTGGGTGGGGGGDDLAPLGNGRYGGGGEDESGHSLETNGRLTVAGTRRGGTRSDGLESSNNVRGPGFLWACFVPYAADFVLKAVGYFSIV